MMFYIGRNDGFYMYVQQDMISLRTIKWLIPEDLHNNEIVKSQMNSKPFAELIKHMDSIEIYNRQLNNLHLDIERKSIEKRKQLVKEKCYQIVECVNKELLPYHWDIQEDTSERKRDCYLVGLFLGENGLLKRIERL